MAFGNAAAPADRGTAVAPLPDRVRDAPPKLSVSIDHDLATVEADWRRFESRADCTVFQTFDWLAAWHRHVGQREGARPAIAVGRLGGEIAFMLPLCVLPHGFGRRLCWLGQDLSDYNAPLLAADFSERIKPQEFLAAWRDLQALMQRDPLWRHDWIEFEKMPQKVGAQLNPFTLLGVTTNASGAHLTHLSGNWEEFYTTKRSSSTRRRDRTKRRHMSAYGEIRFVSAADGDIRRTFETLMEQKGRALARKGVSDIFARPGYREFYLDIASNLRTRHLVHVSRVEVGAVCAAANLGLVFRDCYYHVLASYDDGDISHYGPGSLHLRELMAYAFARGLKRFDFTIGDEPYKLDWSDTHVKLYDYSTTATWRGLPARLASTVRRRIKRFIKQTPLLWHLVSSTRTAIGSLSRLGATRPQPRAAIAAHRSAAPALACVMGDMDLLRPLALAGIRAAVVARPGVPSLYSRYAQSRLIWDDYAKDDHVLLEALTSFAKAQPERPVLFYEEDAQALLISRFREKLAEAFRFVIADGQLVEDLLDKGRFQLIAERHGLPVPPARRFDSHTVESGDLGLRFPLIIKPLIRLDDWNRTFGLSKALAVDSAGALNALWPKLRSVGIELLAQEFVPGAESQIESYHCYVDQRGGIAGEFTGRKIRTYPLSCGHTTALEITDADDVRREGRAIIEKLELTGVAKLDFKRDPQGRLQLLEINPRFNLWHHAGAVAGVNIPALVYADVVGLKRPPVTRARAGVRWCRLWKDLPAAQAGGVPLAAWLPWVLGSEAKSTLAWDDPLPFLGATFHRLGGRYLAGEPTRLWRERT